ncbi:CD226 antigen-like [Coregonus clupeaformis]|uniref:CD226 antigen-like n=1 Tax=Coregonus clupeaformis TaxID=59861 RepID=UPI001BE11018|nr:CD226 antigen-like [Coregonus clupeaformis]
MEAVQKDHWYATVLILVFSLTGSVLQTNGVTTVKLEEGMVLGCVCPWDGNLSMVSWTKLIRLEKVPVGVYHPVYGVSISQPYQNRIKFLKTTPMDSSITITNVTQEDAGLYQCSVQSFPSGSWARDILVEDADQEETDIHTREPEPSPVDFSLSENLIYIYVGGLLVLLSVILILVVWQRKKKRREEYRIKLQRAQRQSCNNSQNVPVYDRMRKETNQSGDGPVYANIHTIHSHTKRKR